jgi:ATP-dependent Clp protease ATP-binding subunit ClpC
VERDLDARARGVMERAAVEARAMRHNYVGTEHVLLALIDGGDDTSAILHRLEVTGPRARQEVERIVGPGRSAIEGELPLTPRASAAIDLAGREAERLGVPAAGPAALLLGLIDQAESVASKVVARLGVDAVALRHAVQDLADGPDAAAGAAPWPAAGPKPSEPLCPVCRQQLLSGLAVRSVFVDGGGARWLELAYCRTCGTTIGVVPGSST